MTIIRKAAADDIGKIAAVEAASFTDPWSEKSLLSAVDIPMGIFLAAVSDDEISGYIIGSFDGDAGYIEKVAVSHEHRRMGIGTQLIKAFRENISAGAEITLEVRQSNSAAIALYEAQGFSRAGVRKNFYSSPSENAVVMIG